jgi:hypothetical protein
VLISLFDEQPATNNQRYMESENQQKINFLITNARSFVEIFLQSESVFLGDDNKNMFFGVG